MTRLLAFCVALVTVLSVNTAVLAHGDAENSSTPIADVKHRELLEWGQMFGGLAPCYNVKFDCKYNNVDVCCGLVNDPDVLTPNVTTRDVSLGHSSCTISRVYEPSPFENHHFEIARNLSLIQDLNVRRADLINRIRGDVAESNAWLARVQVHMQSEALPEITDDDRYYLSRYHVTKTCTGQAQHLSESWTEWIEPLTIHARHPFGLNECKVYERAQQAQQKFPAGLQSLDYLIIKSGVHIHEETSLTRHTHTTLAPHRNHDAMHREAHLATRNFMLDAGTSTFESSLRWFLCAYLQRKIVFDQDYGWEYTLLEPQEFWKRVPPKIRPIYHFFNAPVSAGTDTGALSPLKFIFEIATPQDFVAFKLDIDTPVVEIPLALELLRTPEVGRLVDEFFFELHFTCEILMFCAWGTLMPDEFNGLKMDRLSAMTFFQDLRKSGIRAHFWP